MLYQIGLATFQNFQSIHLDIRQFVKKNSQKVQALMMVAKLLSIAVLLALAPAVFDVAPRETYNAKETAVKLDTNSAQALVGKDHQVNIETGVSLADAANKRVSTKVASRIAETPSGVENYIGLYKDAAARYGIPWNVLAAVHYVESGASGSTTRSSYAGAQGPMQFMPGTWRAYAVDGDGDGSTDIYNVYDAVYGAANLLAAGGAAEGNVDAALFNYNHAQWYVDKVNEVAESIQ